MGDHPSEPFPVIPGVVVQGRIARGRHGTVYAAIRESDGAAIAVKHRKHTEPPAPDEAALLSGLHHPNLVEVLELPGAGPQCDVMELVDGVSLRELLLAVAAADEDMPLVVCAEIAREVALGLAALHSYQGRNLVHGDVSPSNVLLGHDGMVRVADFGSLTSEGAHPRTRFGTIGYLSPEGLAGGPPLRSSDLFALGSLVFEMLTGSPPQFAMAPEHAVPDVQDFRDDAAPELEELLYELLAERPESRPDAPAAAGRLSAFVESCSPRPNLKAYLASFFGDLPAAPTLEPAAAFRVGPSAPVGFRISGSAVKGTFEFLVSSHGAKGYELVRARLSPQTQAVLQRHVDSSAWFDASVLVELTEVAESTFGVGQPGEVARAIGAASADYAMSENGPFRVFRERGLRDGIPAFLRSTEDIYGLYYDRGRWCIETVSNGAARCRHVDGADFPPPIVDRIFAYLVRGLELVGARDVVLDREPEGADWVVRLRWNAPAG